MTTANISYYLGPISNLVPYSVCSISQLHTYITTNEWLATQTAALRATPYENEPEQKKEKKKFPYVTPLGVFKRRCEEGLIVPSGEIVIDLDHTVSVQMAYELRDELFEDQMLKPDLAFVSPREHGVKLFVPYVNSGYEPLVNIVKFVYDNYWSYVERKYGEKYVFDVDRCGELSRGCTICHDQDAKIRI